MPVTCPGAPQRADFDDGRTEKWPRDANSSANRQDLVRQLLHIRASLRAAHGDGDPPPLDGCTSSLPPGLVGAMFLLLQ
jgi:hypothetical protein